MESRLLAGRMFAVDMYWRGAWICMRGHGHGRPCGAIPACTGMTGGREITPASNVSPVDAPAAMVRFATFAHGFTDRGTRRRSVRVVDADGRIRARIGNTQKMPGL